MDTYESLTDAERDAVEIALNTLAMKLAPLGAALANDDRAARAAEALARYIVESRA